MIHQPFLDYVNELVIAAWVGGKKKEAWIDQIANGVEYDSFHNFPIKELESHPDAMDRGHQGVKVKILVLRVPLETMHIEDSLNLFEGYVFDSIGIEMPVLFS